MHPHFCLWIIFPSGNEKYEKIQKKRRQNMGVHIKGGTPSSPSDIADWEEILQEEEENQEEEERQSNESSYLQSSAVKGSSMGSSRKLSMKSLMESPPESSLESSKDESVTSVRTAAPRFGRSQLFHVTLAPCTPQQLSGALMALGPSLPIPGHDCVSAQCCPIPLAMIPHGHDHLPGYPREGS